MTGLETKLRKWSGQADLSELLLVILQDIHYYSSAELFAFKEQLERLAKSSTAEKMKAKADYLFSMRQYYGALRLYDRIFTLRSDELLSEGFRGNVWFNKGSALAGIFSFDQAAECYQKAYQLLQSEEPLRKLWELHFLDELVDIPAELQEKVPAETQYLWKPSGKKSKKEPALRGQQRRWTPFGRRTASVRRKAWPPWSAGGNRNIRGVRDEQQEYIFHRIHGQRKDHRLGGFRQGLQPAGD